MPPSILERATLAKNYNEILSESYPNQKINPNLAVCNKGVLVEVYKGTSDELNNALYYTYNLHEQVFENQIVEILPRDPNLKALRCLRMVLSLCSKTIYRENVKEALRSDVHRKIMVLKNIDFDQLVDFGKSLDIVDVKKTIAFQLGQTLALLQGMECYTKSEVATFYPDLRPCLYRQQSTDWHSIKEFASTFLTELALRLPHMKQTEEYLYNRP